MTGAQRMREFRERRRRAGGYYYAAICKAWDAAPPDDRQRFLETLREHGSPGRCGGAPPATGGRSHDRRERGGEGAASASAAVSARAPRRGNGDWRRPNAAPCWGAAAESWERGGGAASEAQVTRVVTGTASALCISCGWEAWG